MAQISKRDLVGVWKLEEFIVHSESGEDFIWPGEQSGTLIYTENGYVSVAQNRQPLPNPTAEDRARTSNFYIGTYDAQLERGLVVHTPLQSSVASIIGVAASGQVKFGSDGRLWLSGVGLKESVTLVWRRV